MSSNDNKRIVNVNCDMVTRAQINWWAKEQVSACLKEGRNTPFLQMINTINANDSIWLKKAVEEGKPAYFFDETKVPEEFKKDLEFISGKPYSDLEGSVRKAVEEVIRETLENKQSQAQTSCEMPVTDIHGTVHDINNIVAGTVFKELNASHKDFIEFPASFANCKVKESFVCSCCRRLTTFQNCPPAEEIYCIGNTNLESLEGCYKGVKKIYIDRCYKLKYIPNYIPDCAIKGLSAEKIAECKANWRAMNQQKTFLDKIRDTINSFTHSR